MKQDSMKILFFFRKSRLKKNGEAPVFLRIRSACEKIFLYLCAQKRQMFLFTTEYTDYPTEILRSCFEFLQKVFLGLMYPFSCVLWAIFWPFSLLFFVR